MHADEAAEQLRALLRWYAVALVEYGDARAVALQTRADDDPGSVRRVLQRVADEVEHDLERSSAVRLDDQTTIPAADNDIWLASPFPHLMPALGTVRARAMPAAFLDFCRAWRWEVASASRRDGAWEITGAWTWGG